MNRVTVWPQRGVSPSLVRDLAQRFPQALIVYHGAFGFWQIYDSNHGDWDARRLFTAIQAHNAHDRDSAWQWWQWPQSPTLWTDLPIGTEPGTWLLAYLGRHDLHRQGGARAYLREFEERERQRKLARHAERFDETRERTKDARRHIRDVVEGDPMAGRRKWIHTVTTDTKGDRA